jgi:RNA polymerase sigma factor (sigma-70 family)
MPLPATHAELDSLAEQYARVKDPTEADHILGRLLFEYCAPLIRAIAGPRLRSSTMMAQDLDDVCGDALLELVSKVEEVRSGAAQPIESFSRYTAVVAYRACHDYFRRRFPERHRLKNRLRYLLKPERGFDLWEAAGGEWICGCGKWRDADMPLAGVPSTPPEGVGHMSPCDLLSAIFKSTGGPVEFDALVDFMAELWGVKDHAAGLHLVESLTASDRPSAEADVRARLQRLWKEVGELSRAQRVALLLNLRVEAEKCPLELFPLSGIASMREIAAVLEISAEELAELWNKLPLDDLSIAGRLQVTRQQVINLRKSARKRLERRMAAIKMKESASFMVKTLVCLCAI